MLPNGLGSEKPAKRIAMVKGYSLDQQRMFRTNLQQLRSERGQLIVQEVL